MGAKMATQVNGERHFHTMEEAWFWYMSIVERKERDGWLPAHKPTRAGVLDPMEVYRVMEKLYRSCHLTLDHLRVLRYYGMRGEAPNPMRRHEQQALTLWRDAMNLMGAIQINRGIVDLMPANIEAVDFRKGRG